MNKYGQVCEENCGCVCVRERERERGRAWTVLRCGETRRLGETVKERERER